MKIVGVVGRRVASPLRLLKIFVPLLLGAVWSIAQTPVPAGGGWMRVQRTDEKASTAQTVFFVAADPDDPERSPSLEISCTNRQKQPMVLYRADVMLDPQAHDTSNYYAPAIWAWIKLDKEHLYRALWDIGPAPSPREAKSAIVDRKTMRGLLHGERIKIRFDGHNGQEFTDAFTISGLDSEQVRDACGSKWFGKD